MYLKNKPIVTLVVFLVIFSMAIILSPQVSAAASGSVTYSPAVFSINVPTLTVASGGNFGSGSTVYFYVSSSTSSSGIIGSYMGLYTLSSGVTSLSNSHVKLTTPSTITSGSYYILASDSSSPTSSGAHFTSPTSIIVTSLLPSFSVTGTQPTTLGTITGSGWDAGASVTLYLAGADGTSLNYLSISSFVTTAPGSITGEFVVPSTAQGSYTGVCEENTGANAGVTADSTIMISPIVLVSPVDINGASGTSLSVTGYGFPAGAKIGASSISAGGVTISNPATTTDINGYFSVSGALTSAITSTGSQYVKVTYNTSSYVQNNAFYVSVPNPTALGFTFSITSTSGYYYSNTPFDATIYNFPASSTANITLGSILLGSITTDSDGYGTLNSNLPAMIAGSYYPSAVSDGLYKTLTPVTISAYYEVMDPSENLMTSTYSEYMPSNGTYTVIAYGLSPITGYSLTDTGAGPASQVVSVSIGTYSSITSEFTPAMNGTLLFKFKSVYTSISTGSFESVSLSGVIGYSSLSFGYKAVGAAVYSVSMLSILTPGNAQLLTISNIIAEGANVYSGLNYIYNVYLGTTELSFKTSSGSTSLVRSSSSSSSSTGSLTFTVPSLSSGVYDLTLVYNGQSVVNAVYSLPMIVSVAGTSPSSGTLTAVTSTSTLYIAGAGYYGTSVSLYYMTYTILNGPYTITLTSGAFSYSFPMPTEPAGSYAAYTVLKYAGQSYYVYAYYNVVSTILLTPQSGSIYTSVSFTLSGFSPNSLYTVYVGNINVGTFITDATGSLSSSFNVPVLPSGTYTVSVTPINSNTVIASALFKITASSTISLSTNSYAFPTEIVQFSWAPAKVPHAPTGIVSPATGTAYGPVYVTVYLNRSAYTSPIQATCGIVDATTYLNGSFIAPNLAAGSYWAVSFGWTQNIYTIGNHTANGSTYPNTYVETSGTYLGLISGSGALLTGITSGEIATLEVAINSTITSTMRVPLNELNAAVVAIQGTSALINTSFGQMKTTLNDISASIQSISNGQVYINTSIGKVMTQLTNINAAIARVNGSIIELSTVLGTVNTTLNNLVPIITRISSTTLSINTLAGEINYNLTSFSNLQITTMNNNVIAVEGYINGVNVTMQATLSALNATITSTASNVNSLLGSAATIKTDLGTITGQITTVQSGIATIQTSLGSINVTVNSIKTTGTSNKNSLNISYYFEIVLIVLAALILVFVIMTFIGNRRRP